MGAVVGGPIMKALPCGAEPDFGGPSIGAMPTNPMAILDGKLQDSGSAASPDDTQPMDTEPSEPRMAAGHLVPVPPADQMPVVASPAGPPSPPGTPLAKPSPPGTPLAKRILRGMTMGKAERGKSKLADSSVKGGADGDEPEPQPHEKGKGASSGVQEDADGDAEPGPQQPSKKRGRGSSSKDKPAAKAPKKLAAPKRDQSGRTQKSQLYDEASRNTWRVRLANGTSKGFRYGDPADKEAKKAVAQQYLDDFLKAEEGI